MVSCALSTRRGPLRRPKVCDTHSASRLSSGCYMRCSLSPAYAKVEQFLPFLFSLFAYDADSAKDSLVVVVLDGDGGDFVLFGPLLNGRYASAEFSSPSLGVYNLTATCTSIGGGICICNATITVVSM